MMLAMMNVLFALLLVAGVALIALKVAKDKGWALPAGLAAAVSGGAYWFRDLADRIGGWF